VYLIINKNLRKEVAEKKIFGLVGKKFCGKIISQEQNLSGTKFLEKSFFEKHVSG